jgi:trimeric autotransporter adhesin
MATKLYLRQAATVRPELQPFDQTTVPASGYRNNYKGLNISVGGVTGMEGSVVHSSGPVTSPGVVGSATQTPVVFTSPPISNSVTVSGQVSWSVWAREAAMTTNSTVAVVIWAFHKNGTYSVIFTSSNVTELTTTLAEYAWNGTPNAVSLSPGDVIAVGIYFDDASGATLGSSTSYFAYDAAPPSWDSFVQFTEDITFSESAPTGTTTNLLETASDLSGKNRLWTDTTSTQTSYVVNTSASPQQNQWTATAGGSTVEWITPQLQAVTFSGLCSFTTWALTSDSNSGVTTLARLYKTAADGTGAVQIGAGRSFQSAATTTTGLTFYVPVGVTIADGERLMVRLYTTASNVNQASGYTATVKLLEGASQTSMRWPVTLTEYSGGGNQSKPTSDTLTATVSESASIANALSATDTLTSSISDSVSVAVAVPTSDTLTASVSEGVSIEISVPKPVSDTVTATIGDTASISASFAKTDSLSGTVSENVSVSVSVSVTDSLTATVSNSESIGISLDKSVSDTLTGSVSQSVSVSATLSKTDSLTASVSETIAIAVAQAVADAVTATIANTASNAASISVTDTVSATIADPAPSISSAAGVTPSDTLTATVSQSISISVAASAADTLTSTIGQSIVPSTSLSLTDTLTSTVANTATIQNAIAISDALAASITQALTSATQLSVSDTITVTVLQSLVGFPTEYGFKYYNGSWQTVTAKYWNGTSWANIASVKRYNGSTWV